MFGNVDIINNDNTITIAPGAIHGPHIARIGIISARTGPLFFDGDGHFTVGHLFGDGGFAGAFVDYLAPLAVAQRR